MSVRVYFSKICGNKIVASCFKTDTKNIHQEVLIRTQGSMSPTMLCFISTTTNATVLSCQ